MDSSIVCFRSDGTGLRSNMSSKGDNSLTETILKELQSFREETTKLTKGKKIILKKRPKNI